MENTLPTLQRRRILFLISLPQTLEFNQDREEIAECLGELREQQVDVRERITCDDLQTANKYDVVIVVAHHDNDADTLVLADGMMPMQEFVSSIPTDFAGVLDFSSCDSISAFIGIKERCPQCKVQATLSRTPLLRRIIMYPSVVELMNDDPTIDYRTAYETISKDLDAIVDDVVSPEDNNVEMTHLGGEKMSSIYAPSEIKRGSWFQVMVFFHYDTEKKIMKARAEMWQSNSLIRDNFELPVSLEKNDTISISLHIDSVDNAQVEVRNNAYSKQVELNDDWVSGWFEIKVLPDFNGSSLGISIGIEKNGETIVECHPFNVEVANNSLIHEVATPTIGQKDMVDNYQMILCHHHYEDVDQAEHNLFNNSVSYEYILKEKTSDEEKVAKIRKFIYSERNNLLKRIIEHVSWISGEIESDKNKEPAKQIYSLLQKLYKNAGKLDEKYKKVSWDGERNVKFEEIPAQTIQELEMDFINLVSSVRYLGDQAYLYNKARKVSMLIKTMSKEQIRKDADEFWTIVTEDKLDLPITDAFEKVCAIKHPRWGVTVPYRALFIAMLMGKYSCKRKSQKDRNMSVMKYMDDVSVTALDRTEDIFNLLDNGEFTALLTEYQEQCTKQLHYSVLAHYLTNIKMDIV